MVLNSNVLIYRVHQLLCDVSLVTDISRGTTLESKGMVMTISILAALSGLEIDNVLIEVDGPEALF